MRTRRNDSSPFRHFIITAQDSGLLLQEECTGPKARKLAGEFAKDYAREIERRRLACPEAKWQAVVVQERVNGSFVQVFSAFPGDKNWALLLK